MYVHVQCTKYDLNCTRQFGRPNLILMDDLQFCSGIFRGKGIRTRVLLEYNKQFETLLAFARSRFSKFIARANVNPKLAEVSSKNQEVYLRMNRYNAQDMCYANRDTIHKDISFCKYSLN